MKRILIINGPNINLLGIREKQIYGNNSYVDLLNLVDEFAKENGLEIIINQITKEILLIKFNKHFLIILKELLLIQERILIQVSRF